MPNALRDHLVGAGYRAGWWTTRHIPEGWAYRGFDAMSTRSWKRGGPRRAKVEQNLAAVLGDSADLASASRDAFHWYGRYWLETFRMQDLPSAELTERFRVTGVETIEKAHAAGGGILATMHLGNWDAGGRWVAERWPLTAVVEVLRPRSLFDRFVAHRESLGMEIIPLIRGADVTKECMKHLERGRTLALVSDRDTSTRGIEVGMFGRRTKIPPGPSVLALRTGAPLIPAVIYMKEDGSWQAHVNDALEVQGSADDPDAVADVAGRLATSFEGLVRRAPTQWHAMFQRYWL